MRTTEEMREYQRLRRAVINPVKRPRGRPRLSDDKISPDALRMRESRDRRNAEQSVGFKTVGGRAKYFACTKTAKHRFGVFANEPSVFRRNGVPCYGYSL